MAEQGKLSAVQTVSVFLPALVAYAWLVSKASWYWNHREDLAFGWVVLLLSGYVLFEQWEKWNARSHDHAHGHGHGNSGPGALARVAGFILSLAGFGMLFQFQIYTASMGMKPAALMGLMVGCYGLIFGNLLWVTGWRGALHFAFGFLFLVVAMPMPSIVQGIVINGLQNLVSTIVVEILTLVGIPAQQVGSLIHLPTGTVGVDEACSGIRSLQSTVMATLFIGYLSLRHWSMQAVLFFAGVILVFVGNIFRAFFLSYMANAHGLEAIDQYHDGAGYSVLAFSVCGVALLAWVIVRVEKFGHVHSREQWLEDLVLSVVNRRDAEESIEELDFDESIDAEEPGLDPSEKAEIFGEIQRHWGVSFFDDDRTKDPETWRDVVSAIVLRGRKSR